jgi:hypothetical protein
MWRVKIVIKARDKINNKENLISNKKVQSRKNKKITRTDLALETNIKKSMERMIEIKRKKRGAKKSITKGNIKEGLPHPPALSPRKEDQIQNPHLFKGLSLQTKIFESSNWVCLKKRNLKIVSQS